MRVIKRSLLGALITVVVVGVLVSIAYVQYMEKKWPKVPNRTSSSLHQVHEIDGDTVRLQLVGDMGWNGEPQKRVSAAMERQCKKQRPDALVFLGDNIYREGVDSVDDPKWDSHLLKFYQGECLKDTPIYALLGNHDYIKNAQAQIDYALKNPRWRMPFRYYDVAFSDVLSLTAGDAWFPNYCINGDDNCALNFLGKSLKRHADKPWRIVATHYPIRSISAASSGHRGSAKGWLHDKYLCSQHSQPTTYVSGHAHHLEHNRLSTCDMDLLVSGSGGGSDLYPIQEDRISDVEFAKSTYGFLELTATKTSLTYTFYEHTGERLYTTTKYKKNHDAVNAD